MNRLVRTSMSAVIIAAASVAALTAFASAAHAAGSSVPFKDPSARGYIALCDLAGHNVTSGSVDTAPFAWKAISSKLPPADYRGKGENAALTVYQARKGIDPSEWNGDQLSAASFYPAGENAAAESTYKDLSLRAIIHEFPPSWDGLYELRMVFAKSNFGNYTDTYPAAVIQVTGNTWHLVQGGTLPCAAAKPISTETFTGVKVVNPKQSPRAQTPTSAPTSEQASTAPSTAPGSAQAGASHIISTTLSGDAHSASSGSNSTAIVIASVGGVVIVLIAAALFWRRRQGSATS